MENILWIIYWIGVVLCPIFVGMMFGKRFWKDPFALIDIYAPLAILSLLWPIFVLLITIMGLAAALCYVIGGMFMCLFLIGQFVGKKLKINNDIELL